MLFKVKKMDFCKSKLYKKLKKAGCLYEFIDTINYEINKEDTIKYFDETMGYGIIVTKTWFVYVDNIYPKFVKSSEIIEISDEISTSSSHRFLSLRLKDNSYINIEYASCEDIKEELIHKYPEIKIL
jgi:hypothetical protein